MARTKKDSPEAKETIRFIKATRRFVKTVKDMRRLQKLTVNSKEPAARDKFKIRADKKARAVDNQLDKFAA